MFTKLIKCFFAVGLMCGWTAQVCAKTTSDWVDPYAGQYKASFYVAPVLQYNNYYVNKPTYQSLSPRFALGYGGVLNYTVYLAGEVFVIPFSASLKNHPSQFGGLKTSTSYGASLLPGYFFDDSFMGYVRLGYVSTRFEKLDARRSGFEVGVGVEIVWTCNWSILVEYDYLKFTSIQNIGTPRSQQALLGLKYRFI